MGLSECTNLPIVGSASSYSAMHNHLSFVTVWSPLSYASADGLIICTIGSEHLEALYGGQERSKETVLV